jgi:hypothetical protein
MVVACSAEDIWTPSESKVADHIVRTTLLLRKITLPTGYEQGASYVAGIAGSSSHADRGLHHGADHLRVLAYAETIVGAPQHNFAGALRRLPSGVWKAAGDTLKSREHPVAPLASKTSQHFHEKSVVTYECDLVRRPGSTQIPFRYSTRSFLFSLLRFNLNWVS